MITAEVVRMKRLLAFLMMLILAFSACSFAETDDGDDSNPVPVDMMEEEEMETEAEFPQGRVLQYGDEGDDVLALQTRLQDLKYYSGKLSGKFRDGTRKAVETFQADFDLDQTGVADMRTLSILFSLTHRPLRFGSSGDDVKQLQTQLTELGYYKGKISGNYLEATQKAVEQLQKKNKLEVNGIADADLQDMIFSKRVIGKNDAPEETNTPGPNLSNYLVDDNAATVAISEDPVEFSKKLKSGSKGKLVKKMQQRLAELGYYEGPISGSFQKYTTRAVKALQTQNGIESNGVVDETTWNLIFNDIRVVLPDATPKPTPEPTPVPFHVVVDVANQVTSVYGRDEQGEYTVVVRQMLCSTGKKATPSSVGDWVLNGRHATWCIFPKWGNSYARYWTRINSDIAFHSPIYTAVSNSAMQISSYKALGRRASHGCIRLSVWDAKWIYDNIGKGTVVSIVEGMEPDPELRDALKLPPLDKKYCTPISTPVPTPEPEYRADRKPDLKGRKLKEKSESEAVYWVQRTLKDLGYYDTKCTGKMLKKTVNAVKAFQKAQGLYPGGTVDQKLIDLMAEVAAGTYETNANKATPEPMATPAP